jgi:CubicO group peptidase (beta-lactamase class C family)
MIRGFFVSVFCAAQVAASTGQDLTVRVDAHIQAEMKRQNIPGLSLAIVQDGKPILVKGYGIANLEHNVPVKPETIFQSGSVGKQFTAAAVMLLVEDGKVALDEKAGRYLGPVPAAWNDITVRHLLTHTAGLASYPKGFDFRRDYTEDELLKVILGQPLAFKPGDKWQYANLGYVALGILISKVSGKFYGDFLQERVFKPLGMATARIISEADIVPNRAAGYQFGQGALKNQNWVSPTMNTTADGSLYLSLLDMIKWDAAQRPGALLKQSSLDAMWTPVKLNAGTTHPYGFGWALNARNGRKIIEHGGAWQGFMSHIARYVDDGLSVIVFVNRGGVPAGAIANGVAALVDPDLVEKPAADKQPALTAAHRKLLADLVGGNTVDRNQFTPQVAAEVLPKIEQSRERTRFRGSAVPGSEVRVQVHKFSYKVARESQSQGSGRF